MTEPNRIILRARHRLPKAARITFNEDNIERQYFAFPYPEMCYIRENANGETRLKLWQTCKFFYKKNPQLIVKKLVVDDSISSYVFEDELYVRNVGEMPVIDVVTDVIHCDPNDKRLFTKIRRCEAKSIFLPATEISNEELLFFTQSDTVKNWNAFYTTIRDDDDNPICLEDLLYHLPGADYVRAIVQDISHESSSKSVSKNNSIKELFLRFQGMMNVDDLYKLLRKVLAPKAVVRLSFIDIEDRTYFATFKAEMNAMMKAWEPKVEKPDFRIVPR